MNEPNQIDHTYFAEAVAYLLRETFEGSPAGQPSVYLDRGIGIFPTLNELSAADVSRDVGGTTIVAQAEHAKFYIDRLCEFINGETTAVNWDDSWLIETVNDTEWEALRSTVRTSYENAIRCVASLTEWNERQVGMALGLVAHTAYHLGAIRQIRKSIK